MRMELRIAFKNSLINKCPIQADIAISSSAENVIYPIFSTNCLLMETISEKFSIDTLNAAVQMQMQ